MIAASLRLSKPTPLGKIGERSELLFGAVEETTVANMLRVRTSLNGFSGAPGLMTIYFNGLPSYATADATEACARVRAFLNAARSLFPISWTADVSPAVDLIDDVSGILQSSLTGATPAQVIGTGTGGYTPVASGALLTHNTNAVVGGRRLRGRTFLVPIGANNVSTAGTFVPASATTLATAAALLGTVITTSGITPCVWHRPGPSGAGSSAATSAWAVASRMAVLRSRRD